VEKKYTSEASTAAAAHAKEVKKLQKSLTKYKNSSKNLSAGLAPLKRNLGDLRASHRVVVKTVADELNLMKNELVQNFSGGILRKLKVSSLPLLRTAPSSRGTELGSNLWRSQPEVQEGDGREEETPQPHPRVERQHPCLPQMPSSLRS
jgi:hypothetical protein